MRKHYSSFEQIDLDLQILRVKREIHYQKINSAFDQLKDEAAPQNLLKSTLGSAGSLLTNSSGIQTLLVTSIFKYIIRKFRK